MVDTDKDENDKKPLATNNSQKPSDNNKRSCSITSNKSLIIINKSSKSVDVVKSRSIKKFQLQIEILLTYQDIFTITQTIK